MKISLVAIRLEIADDCPIPKNFKSYCAPFFECAAEEHLSLDSKPSYAQVARQLPSSSKENTPSKPFSEYRGTRVNEEIIITYLSTEEIQEMEKEAAEREAEQKAVEAAQKAVEAEQKAVEAAQKAAEAESAKLKEGHQNLPEDVSQEPEKTKEASAEKKSQSSGATTKKKKHAKEKSKQDASQEAQKEDNIKKKKEGPEKEKSSAKYSNCERKKEDFAKEKSRSTSLELTSEVGMINFSRESLPREQDSSSARMMMHHKSGDSSEDSDGPGPTPGTPWKRQKSRSPPGWHASTVHFSSGNPSVEQVKGVLHIYKDSQKTPLDDDVARSEMLCMMAIPAGYTIHDLIQFTAPLNASMENMQVLKGAMRNQYMLLIKFKDQKAADEFYQYFNSRPFNSIEEYLCHLVYVAQVEITRESEGGSMPIKGLTELPHCPVCLERMEESVDGILTVLCNHSFHMSCLAQWGDTSCPVCRYCQTPEEVPDQRCMQCGSQESLWICLICGCVGCGRYVGLHAYTHFQETNHTYAMQLGTNHVWDYAGDNYVHRLAQNKSDGKLVQLGEQNNSMHEEKLDSITLEYTYLLTTQLESQRRYFEEKIIEETKGANLRVKEVEEQVTVLRKEKDELVHQLAESNKEKHALDKKCNQMHSRLASVLSDLQEEREMNKCLMENQQLWQKRVTTLEGCVKDLSESKERLQK